MSAVSSIAMPSTRNMMATATEILGQLIARDDAMRTTQFLAIVRELDMDYSGTQQVAGITKTIDSLLSKYTEIGSVVLVAAAKHGCPNIVKTVLASNDLDIPTAIALEARDEARQNKHINILENLTQYAVSHIENNSASKQDISMSSGPHQSDTDSDASISTTCCEPTIQEIKGYDELVEELDATENMNTKLLLTLFDPRMRAGAQDNAALWFACYDGDTKRLKELLLNPHVDPAAKDNSAIKLACMHGRSNAVQILLADPRVDPSADNNHAIELAIHFGNAETVKVMLTDHRVDASTNIHFDPFRITACPDRHTEVVKLLLLDPRIDPTANNNRALRHALEQGHAETVSVMLDDHRVVLTPQQSRDYIYTAIRCCQVDLVSVLLTRFPMLPTHVEELSFLCAKHGRLETLKHILQLLKPHHKSPVLIYELFKIAFENHNYQFVLELLTDPYLYDAAHDMMTSFAQCRESSFEPLVCSGVDLFRIVATRFVPNMFRFAKRAFMNTAFRMGNVDVVQELLDNHKCTFEDWNMDHFDIAALHGNVPVMRMLLTTPRYGGCEKLIGNPPLSRIYTRKVLEGIRIQNAVMLMWCVKKIMRPRKMARLLDVLRDLVSGDLIRFKMK